MTGKLKNWFHGQKDASMSFLLEKMLQKKLERYGQLIEFKLDSRQNSAWIKLLPKGETESVSLWIDEYQLVGDGSASAVVVKRARASREWLSLLIQDFLLGRSFPIPDKYASVTRMLL